MDLGIKGRTALVIGASKNIGRAVALRLAAEGAKVIAVARDMGALAQLQVEIAKAGGLCVASAGDLMGEGAVAALVSNIRDLRAEPEIIYHAIGGSWNGLREWERPASDYAEVWRYNVGIPHDINRAFIPKMIEHRWGRIVMTSSDATKCNSGNAPYTSSKFALEGYVKTVSKQLARNNVILTAVAPGNIMTAGGWPSRAGEDEKARYLDSFVAGGRFSSCDEIAQVVLPLCGEPAAWMPGAIVRCDGGSR